MERDEMKPTDPTQVGRWSIRARLGAGAMGIVYLGVDGSESCAIKVIRPDLANEPTFHARFRREIAAAGRVSSPFVASVIEAGPDDDIPWMASELIHGPSLEEFVRDNGVMEADALVQLASALTAGLDAIHQAGVVHRDLKPSNVLLGPDGPRIVDFGIAHTAAATTLTTTGLIVGSPSFMSPEQALGQPVTGASDVFALASVVVFAASGRGPFGTGTSPDVLYRVVHEAPRVPELPPPLDALVRASLAKDPNARPTTNELHLALTTDMDPEQTIAAYPAATSIMLSGETPQVQLPDTTRHETTRRLTRRSERVLTGAAAAIIAIAVIVFLLATHASKGSNPKLVGTQDATTRPSPTTRPTPRSSPTTIPPPELTRFVPSTYHITSTAPVNLDDSTYPQMAVTAVGPISIAGFASSTVLLLSWDPIAKRWTTAFDASKQTSYMSTLESEGTGPGLLGGSDPHPTIAFVHDQANSRNADLVYWLNSPQGNGSQLIVGVVHYANQLAHLAWNFNGDEGDAQSGSLRSVAVIGAAPRQQLKITVPWQTQIDPRDYSVRTYSFTVAPNPKYAFDQYSVTSDDRPLVGVTLVPGSNSTQGEVTTVADGSPAVGILHQGDLVDGVDGAPAPPSFLLGPVVIDQVASHHPGDTVALDIERQGQHIVVSVTLGEWNLGEPGYPAGTSVPQLTM